MNRLRDESGLDPASERGIELLRSVRPTSSPAGLKRRVWATLQQQLAADSAARPRSLVLRVVVICLGVVAFAATAAATVGGRTLVVRLRQLFTGPADTTTTLPRQRIKPARTLAEKPAPSAAEAEEGPAAEPAPAPPVSIESHRARHASASSVHAPHVSADLPAAAGEAARERTQVLDALYALRRDRDPARALALLNRELAAHPHGALREQALALAIEAADARGDSAGAERFARTYQSEFPSGQFKQVVQTFLDGLSARSPSHQLP
jgi:hypothetical protein